MLEVSLLSQDWYNALVDECGAIITESVYRARQELIEGRHLLGRRILEEVPNFERQKIYGQKIVQMLAESLNVSTRTLYYAMSFATKFPVLEEFLETVEEGKNLSWNKIVTKYLPAEGKETVERFKNVCCPNCNTEFSVKL